MCAWYYGRECMGMSTSMSMSMGNWYVKLLCLSWYHCLVGGGEGGGANLNNRHFHWNVD